MRLLFMFKKYLFILIYMLMINNGTNASGLDLDYIPMKQSSKPLTTQHQSKLEKKGHTDDVFKSMGADGKKNLSQVDKKKSEKGKGKKKGGGNGKGKGKGKGKRSEY